MASLRYNMPMWLALSLLALFAGSIRRSAEKQTTRHISSLAMVWLQQAVALPVIIVTLFFARFYWPQDLPAQFWLLLTIYIITSAIDVYCYFKALSLADISYIAPLTTLFVVGNLVGAYLVLHQIPSPVGALGALLVMAGAYITSRAKKRQASAVRQYRLVLWLILASVLLKSFYSNIEVLMLQLANPTSYNFYTSALTIPFVIAVTIIVLRQRQSGTADYWAGLRSSVRQHIWPLACIGVTYTVAMLATYQAKLLAPNAAYVGAIKAAIVVPLVLIGVLFFKEKVSGLQWTGLGIIVAGIVALAFS
jgi:drug/metabolite transporter (DMT)-like permease